MQFRDFPMIFCRKSMDSGPDFVQNYDFNRDFHKNLNFFFENFLRNYLKFVYLWKISILSMDIFLVLLKKFGQILTFFYKFWSLLVKMYWFPMRNWENPLKISISEYIWARTDQNLKKNLRIWSNKNFGALEIYSFVFF